MPGVGLVIGLAVAPRVIRLAVRVDLLWHGPAQDVPVQAVLLRLEVAGLAVQGLVAEPEDEVPLVVGGDGDRGEQRKYTRCTLPSANPLYLLPLPLPLPPSSRQEGGAGVPFLLP